MYSNRSTNNLKYIHVSPGIILHSRKALLTCNCADGLLANENKLAYILYFDLVLSSELFVTYIECIFYIHL